MGNPHSQFDGHYSHVYPADCGYTFSTDLPPGTRGAISQKDWKWCAATINKQMPSDSSNAMLFLLILVAAIIACVGASQKLSGLAILGLVMMCIAILVAWGITSSVSQGLHSACVTINGRLNGCVEVAQHASGKSKTYYIKIDVVRLKELKQDKAAKEKKITDDNIQPPSYEITVKPTAPTKEADNRSRMVGSKNTSATTLPLADPRMAQLKQLRDDGIISEEEYENAKNRIPRV